VTPGEWKEGITSRHDLHADESLEWDAIDVPPEPVNKTIFTAIHSIKAMLNEARIALPSDFELEISHHYGMENFNEFGTVIISCINRDYCKKVLVQLPGQKNPLHYHKRKEETFQVLSGVLELEIEDRRKTLHPGDTALVLPGVWHAFWSETGAIFEEVSTTHYNDDSYYADKTLNQVDRSYRKTVVRHWGRHQIPAH
jgi:N-acetylneuraminate synthase